MRSRIFYFAQVPLLLLTLLLGGVSGNPTARAGELGLLSQFLRSGVGEATLATSEGKALLRLFSAKSDTELLRALEAPRAAPAMDELEEALGRIHREFQEMKELRREGSAIPASARELNSREKLFVELLTKRYLRLENPAAFLRELEGGPGEFVAHGRNGGSYAKTQRLFKERPEFRSPKSPLANPAAGLPPAPRQLGESITEWVLRLRDDMKACTLRQPPSTARKNQIRYFLTSLGVTEGLTAVGYFAGAGMKKFRFDELTTEMLVTAFASVTSPLALKGNTSFWVQYVRVVGIQGLQNGVDATIYFTNPAHMLMTGSTTPGHTIQDTAERLEFNTAYSLAASAWREVLMYDLLQGILCLYPGTKLAKYGTVGISLANGTAGVFMYYGSRRAVVGQ